MGRGINGIARICAFIAIVLFCILMPAFLRNIVDGVFEQFRAPLDTIPSQLRDLENYWLTNANSKRKLQEAGRDLARINASNELKMREYNILLDRLDTYQNLLELPSFPAYRGEIARVTRRDMSAWWQRIYIRKGSAHGIKKGDAVINADGVVGRVFDVLTANLSVVELVSSVNFRMAGYFEGDDRPVIYQGAGAMTFRSAAGVVRDVPTDVGTSQEKRLVTSSLAGSFPDGITIGYVRDLNFDSDELFKMGQVRLNPNLASLREVLVLVPVKRDDDI